MTGPTKMTSYLDFAHDSRGVVGDEELLNVVNHHLVHAVRSVGRLGRLGQLFAGFDVLEGDLLQTGIELNGKRNWKTA